MALDNSYIYPTIVAITSMMLNSNLRIKYNYYIIHSQLKIKILLKM